MNKNQDLFLLNFQWCCCWCYCRRLKIKQKKKKKENKHDSKSYKFHVRLNDFYSCSFCAFVAGAAAVSIEQQFVIEQSTFRSHFVSNTILWNMNIERIEDDDDDCCAYLLQ